MDYVVAGFGIGAILALIGFALWELYGNVEEPGKSWLSRAAIGLMLGALVIWSVTGVSLISHIDDSTGVRLVLLTSLVTLIAIAGGVFFYWRADRALAATMPRPAIVSAQREIALAAAVPLVHEDMELSEWDSWPDRDAGKHDAPDEDGVKPGPPASFEPEVAAEAAQAIETDNDPHETDEVDAEGGEAKSETAEPDETGKPEQPAAEAVELASELPDDVRPLRLPATVESSGSDAPDDALIAESVEIAEVEDAGEEPEVVIDVVEIDLADVPEIEESESDETEEDDRPRNAFEADRGSAEPAAYESALLADVDGSLADQDGGYRSPLLSDLGSDRLEGVGLAKWRPDARLTEQDDKVAPPAAKRRHRG